MLLVVVLVAAGVAACTTIRRVMAPTTSTGTDGPTSTTTTSTTPAPALPGSFRVGLTTFHWVDPSRNTVNPATGADTIPGRVLTTQVRYPTASGSLTRENRNAAPDRQYGPYPVIVFAHGFDVSPWYYAPLLDSWVREGFIVISPIFPDESTALVTSVGGPQSPQGYHAELDLANEPADIAFVLRKFDAVAASGSGNRLSGVAATSDVGLAGQSDGAEAVAALAYGTNAADRSALAAMPVAPRAVEVLSGEALQGSYPATNASSPPVLQVQSAADTCNAPAEAASLFASLENAPVHLFETLQGASHLQPYTGLIPGPNPYAPVVDKVTTDFFRLELGWNPGGLSLGAVEAAGAVSHVSAVTATPPGFPNSPSTSKPDCTGFPVSGPTTTTTSVPAGQ